MRIARGWLPNRLAADGSSIEIVDLGGHSLREPFLSQTVEAARVSERGLRSGWVRTEDFEPWSPAAAPAAFLLHPARCGSTLLCHLLQLAGCVVAKEPLIVSDLLLAWHGLEPRTTRGGAEQLFAPVMAQLAGDVTDPPRPLVVKLTAWDSGRCQPLLDRWPDTPIIGITREPVGVVTSQLRRTPDYRDRLFDEDDTVLAWFDHLPRHSDRPASALELHASIWAAAIDTLLANLERCVLLDYPELTANAWGTLALVLEHLDLPGTRLPTPEEVASVTAVDAWDHTRSETWIPPTPAPTSRRTRHRVFAAAGEEREQNRRSALRRVQLTAPRTPGPPASRTGPPGPTTPREARLSGPLVVTLRPRPQVLAAFQSLNDVPPGPGEIAAEQLLDGFGPEARGLGRRAVTEAEHLVALGAATIELHHGTDSDAEVGLVVGSAAARDAPHELYRLVAAGYGAERAFLAGAELAKAVGYPVEELVAVGDSVDGAVGLGNIFAVGDLAVGDTVVDIGCGSGTDLRLAARRVGATGLALGIDRVPEMLDRARRTALATGVTNARFLRGTAIQLPLGDGVADIALANGVLAMTREKHTALCEIGRALRPGGWLHIADQVWEAPSPSNALSRWNAALAGVPTLEGWERLLHDAGFEDVEWSPPVRPFAPEFAAGDLAVRTLRARRGLTAPAPSMTRPPSWHLHLRTADSSAWDGPDLDRVVAHHPEARLVPIGNEGLVWGQPWRTPAFLSPTASLLWQATEYPVRIGDLAEDLADVIGLPPLTAEAECLAFVRGLGPCGLLIDSSAAEPIPIATPLPYVSALLGTDAATGPVAIAPLLDDDTSVRASLADGRFDVVAPRALVRDDPRYAPRAPAASDQAVRLALVEHDRGWVLVSDVATPLWCGRDPKEARWALDTAVAAAQSGGTRFRLHTLQTPQGAVVIQPELAFAALDATTALVERSCRLLPADVVRIDAGRSAVVGPIEVGLLDAIVMARPPDGSEDWTDARWVWSMMLAAVAVDLGQPVDQAATSEAVTDLIATADTVAAADFSAAGLLMALDQVLSRPRSR